jgi:hypothetical protein
MTVPVMILLIMMMINSTNNNNSTKTSPPESPYSRKSCRQISDLTLIWFPYVGRGKC